MTYILIVLLFITGSILIYKAYTNTKDIKINKVKIEAENTLNDTTLSILHLTDLHLENISITPLELEKKLADETPDMIALTGDFLDRKKTIPKLIPYLKVLQGMQPKHGIYAVFGNHDYVLKEQDFRKLKDLLIQFGCHVLQNESETITINGQSIHIIGIDDYSTNRSDLAAAFNNIDHGTKLVLTHDPTVVLEMEHYTFDYLLAGHFHGGQICYPKAYHLVSMGQLARRNMIKGLHTHNNAPFYISEGLGQTGINIRIGSRPEITFHNMLIK
ncbi:metallophosphoesterase [Gracilibacillus alcaliphilus]|uniref:metallophosphoesterase n=1 Tax=Gracilibacillus alcaliphilus TaxID=1401441 RepID=UPI001958EA07|nr:metallophosphoesterase [Gracilibacillus alcaliphilus]MBM7676039.1 putative MPP superfamily phosphohydrolase [Gracilibacillus alcaliphilus]